MGGIKKAYKELRVVRIRMQVLAGLGHLPQPHESPVPLHEVTPSPLSHPPKKIERKKEKP